MHSYIYIYIYVYRHTERKLIRICVYIYTRVCTHTHTFVTAPGYFRFIVPLALIAARALLFQDLRVTGPRAPAFNLSGACAIPALLLLELLEDRVVLHEPGILLRSATFKKEARIFVAIGPSSGILQEPPLMVS